MGNRATACAGRPWVAKRSVFVSTRAGMWTFSHRNVATMGGDGVFAFDGKRSTPKPDQPRPLKHLTVFLRFKSVKLRMASRSVLREGRSSLQRPEYVASPAAYSVPRWLGAPHPPRFGALFFAAQRVLLFLPTVASFGRLRPTAMRPAFLVRGPMPPSRTLVEDGFCRLASGRSRRGGRVSP